MAGFGREVVLPGATARQTFASADPDTNSDTGSDTDSDTGHTIGE